MIFISWGQLRPRSGKLAPSRAWMDGPLSTGWWFQYLWKTWKSIGMILLNIWENKKCSKAPTRVVFFRGHGPFFSSGLFKSYLTSPRYQLFGIVHQLHFHQLKAPSSVGFWVDHWTVDCLSFHMAFVDYLLTLHPHNFPSKLLTYFTSPQLSIEVEKIDKHRTPKMILLLNMTLSWSHHVPSKNWEVFFPR